MKDILVHIAQVSIPTSQVNLPKLTAGNVVESILGATYFLVGIISVIMIIVGGFQYTTAGDAASAAKARKTIIYSVVGLVISLSAFTITQFVLGVF